MSRASAILYRSAPGAEVFGVSPELSYKLSSSLDVTMVSVTLKPKSASIVSLYFEISVC